jgi:hypothetical protein
MAGFAVLTTLITGLLFLREQGCGFTAQQVPASTTLAVAIPIGSYS